MTSRRIAHFELHELLGEGAMGKVYRAIDLELERPVAIKVLGARTVNDPAFIERFKREARLAAQLNHPNIATIYAFGEENGEAYIAMEFVEGETLTDRLARGALPLAEVRKFGRQTVAALAVAHEKGIVHRDIKPGNLMINRQGELKVMDFGVARRSGETELTMAGSLIGTANIMAPELVRGGVATPAADLFSLGCVLYEMLTGRPAFDGETALAILFRVANDQPEPLENLRTDAPPELRDLVNGLLIKDPETRFGPASAVLERLGENATLPHEGTLVLPPGGGTLVLPTGVDIAAPEKPKRRPPAARLILSGLVLAIVVAMAGLWMISKNSGRREAKRLTGIGETLSNSNPDSALAFFSQAVKADSGYARAWNDLGLLSFARGKTKDAIPALEKAADLDEKNDVARLNLADIYRLSGEPAKAESFYNEVISMRTAKLPQAYWGLARLKEPTDQEGAGRLYEAAIAADSSFAAAYNDLGYLFVQERKPDSAEAICRKGIARFRNDRDENTKTTVAYLQKNLGEALLAQRKFEGADSAYQEALRLKGDKFPAAEMGRARTAEGRGDREAARKIWESLVVSGDEATRNQAVAALQRLKSGG